MEKLLRNAIDSIEIGIEDFNLSKDDGRRIISCTRNIFAGILLLFKCKLVELSPNNSDEVLIKQKISPLIDKGMLTWKGEGKKTVDVQGIKDRFKALNIQVNWKSLDKINEYRNDVEHYHNNKSVIVVQEMIAQVFPIINDFIHDYLNKNPESLFNSHTWNTLLEVQEIYEKEKSICLNNLRKLSFYHDEIFNTIAEHKCSDCGYSLIFANNDEENNDADCVNYSCKSCNKIWNYDELIQECLGKKYKSEWWEYGRYGGEAPVIECPECGGQYDSIDQICYNCDAEIDGICQNCGDIISSEDLSFSYPFCGFCNYILEKMEDE